MKLNLKDSVLDEKGKEEFLAKVKQFTDVFSLRDEIGTCPFIEVHLKLKDETPFFVRPYPMREEQKKVIQKEMDRLEHLGIIHKGLTSYARSFYCSQFGGGCFCCFFVYIKLLGNVVRVYPRIIQGLTFLSA